MPNWTDLLNRFASPLAPKGAISGLQERLAPGSSQELPEGDFNWLAAGLGVPDNTGEALGAIPEVLSSAFEHPAETAGGFASGALEGLRSLTSPAALAGMAGGLIAPAVGRMGGLGRAFSGPADDVARQAFDVVDQVPVPQVKPSMGDVNAVIGDARRQMAKVPNATGTYRGPGAPSATRGMPPEFTPVGGEGGYNVGRAASGPANFAPPPGGSIEERLAQRYRQMGPR